MKQELMDAIQETPVIAAVKDDAGLCNALTNENIRVVFVLYGDICNIASIVRRIHEAGRFAAVHVDLIAGLAGKEVAVDFIRNTTEADGIISTRPMLLRRGRELGMLTVLRVFAIDSKAVSNLGRETEGGMPDVIEILPGTLCLVQMTSVVFWKSSIVYNLFLTVENLIKKLKFCLQLVRNYMSKVRMFLTIRK